MSSSHFSMLNNKTENQKNIYIYFGDSENKLLTEKLNHFHTLKHMYTSRECKCSITCSYIQHQRPKKKRKKSRCYYTVAAIEMIREEITVRISISSSSSSKGSTINNFNGGGGGGGGGLMMKLRRRRGVKHFHGGKRERQPVVSGSHF